jgi:uncharacterized protein (DUF1697 family)
MKKHVVFLRGINVSGQKKIKMAELRDELAKNGFHNVQTYIQSGNVVLVSSQNGREIENQVAEIILDSFGHEISVLTLSKEKIKKILRDNPFQKLEDDRSCYFVLLSESPSSDKVTALQKEKFQYELFAITPDCVYLNCLNGYGNAKLNNNLIERKLGVRATTRNLKTMLKMAEMAD